MRKLMVLSVAGLLLATTAVQGETLLARLRVKERNRLADRDPLLGVVRGVAYETQPQALPALPTQAVYEPVPQAAPAHADPVYVDPVYVDPVYAAPAYAAPAPIVGMPVPATFTVYRNVKVRAERKIHPYAVPMIVAAPDPCNPGCEVCVEICAPPCAVADVRCRRAGQKLIYDFGRHEVSVTARRDFIVVSYSR